MSEQQLPDSLTVPMLKWEDTMSFLAGKHSDCGVVLLRIQQTLDDFPWLWAKLGPAIGEIQGIRDGIEQTMKAAYKYWNGSFWQELHKLGFDDPEP